ncbi:uncharacterized protein LOC143231361 [Tachypleus tridentatus]|uniref:uncharacterized protein LOC143231361 n=1 Tax=Tachypleus tridentatus TaxID=6853 RepID=UPI003FD432E3
MRPLIKNIGIDIVKPEGTFKFRGAPLVVVADNFGSHVIGGFLESFSALRSCIVCMVTRDDLRKLTDISKCLERSIASYNYQVAMVETELTLSSTYGIKKRSPLNVLEQFYVANVLPPDILHDLFKSGLVSEILVSLIDQYVLSGYFSVEYLAGRVKEFHCKGTDKINRPELVILRGSVHIKQKAVQVWCLLRIFSLPVGYAVPQDNNKWEVLLALLDMVEFIICPSMSYTSIEFLNDVIQQFHSLYEKEFPNRTLKPKGHFTLHYPEMTRRFGPLRNVWTMRFEAKHSFFVDVARCTKNRRKLAKTMAMRHQYKLCSHLENNGFLGIDGFDLTNSVRLPVNLLEEEQNLVSAFVGEGDFVTKTSGCTVNCLTYNTGTMVVSSYEFDSLQFSSVICCFVLGENLFCIVKDTKLLIFSQASSCLHCRANEKL